MSDYPTIASLKICRRTCLASIIASLAERVTFDKELIPRS